jgi:hypothetical protein
MIASIARSFFMSVGIASLISWSLNGINSHYFYEFLRTNIVSLQIGLLAINTATLGVVLTKLRDLVDKGVPLSQFTRARKEMLLSVKEQVALIVAAIVILSLESASSLPLLIPDGLLRVLLVTCFIYSINILYDTAKSVFVVLGDADD